MGLLAIYILKGFGIAWEFSQEHHMMTEIRILLSQTQHPIQRERAGEGVCFGKERRVLFENLPLPVVIIHTLSQGLGALQMDDNGCVGTCNIVILIRPLRFTG